ncbi:MAG: histidinol dehydrogenase, partial [SAR324 cluster bacterium]|nr:histidinol dehydrogenase [SAR324 cluster bacterium]
MSTVSFHETSKLTAADYKALLKRSEADLSSFVEKVKPIIEAVRLEGDEALVRFGQQLDGSALLSKEALKVSEAEFAAAFEEVEEIVIEAIRYGITNIRTFHEEQKPETMWMKEIRPGAYAGDRLTPIRSVAIYVPRGKGAFPSVTMMTTVPGVVAKVPKLAIFTPPLPNGSVDAATLVAASIAGVDTVYKCGGAQAVAAAAFGTETVEPALKIVGPGSPWVVAAKRSLSDIIDPGLPAGPSEAIIFADDSVCGGLAALDLLIEAEHGPDSSAYLVTHSRRVAEEAMATLPDHWARMTAQRVEFSKTVLTGDYGGILLTSSVEESYQFINDYAPEHLEVQTKNLKWFHDRLKNYGSLFIGEETTVAYGDKCSGTNHIL